MLLLTGTRCYVATDRQTVAMLLLTGTRCYVAT